MPKIQNVSLSSNFLVNFVLPRVECRSYLRRKGINDRFISDNVGLLCSDAVLPGSAMAALNTAGDYQGMVEKFAHTRNFTQVNFDFMVDNQYKSLKFLEHWMEFISGRSNGDPSSDTYFFKMAYPTEYKSNDTRIVKFERNHSQFLEYRFIGLFPLALNSTRVSYQNTQVLKATATFSFDRYICGESSSLARALGLDLNNAGGRSGNARNINYNDAKALDDIINPNYGGLSLLNQGSQFDIVNGRTITGSNDTISNNGGQTVYRVI